MHGLLRLPMGGIYWVGRWALLVYKWVWSGALCMAAVYTLTAWLADRAMRLPRQWDGIGFVLPAAQLGWIMWRGVNLYYKNEPSLFIIIALAALAVVAVLALVSWLITRKQAKAELPTRVQPWGMLAALALCAGATAVARTAGQNTLLTAKMQLMQWDADWDGMIAAGRSAKQPTRAVAAYYAAALEESDQLLEGQYDIPYDFPKLKLDSLDGNEEYGLFESDCNYHAGLLNAGYRCAMDKVVMGGPRLFYYKRMAVCALLMGEKALCRKYLTLIDQMPLEGAFVEKYWAMLDNPALMKDDAELQHVLSLDPREERFEQNYQQPLFLGYNIGLNSGTDATLITSAAACLYSKDLQSFLARAQILAQKGASFPSAMQQALAILNVKNHGLLQQFPQVGQFVPGEISSFYMDAKPYMGKKNRLKLRHELRERWLGTYVYYYYTENNDPDQVVKPKQNQSQVN